MKKNCMILYIGIVSSIDKAPCQSQANKEDKALGNFFCVKGNTWCIDTKTTMIGELLQINENIAPLLLNIGMHCLGCPSSQMETIEEAAMVHGIVPDELVAQINDFLANN